MLPIRYYGTVVCPGVARGIQPIAPLAEDLRKQVDKEMKEKRRN